MASLAELLRQGADNLINLPTKAQQFLVNPTGVIDALTGKTAMPKEKGFAESATGLPQRENMSVLDPNNRAYMEGYFEGEPYGYAAVASPFVAAGATKLSNKAVQAITKNPNATAMGVMDYAGAYNPANIFAYHGTPHLIKDKFDISKVGTGEGAQAYGHGMYFAQSPDVALNYKTKLSGGLGSPSNELMLNGQLLTDLSDSQRRAYEIVARDGRKNALGTAKDMELEGFDASHIRNALKATKGKEISLVKNEGNLYKVDIPDEYIPKMLDYDKPLSQQPKAVQEALEKYDPMMYGPKSDDYDANELGQSIYQRLVQNNVQKFGLGGNSKRASDDLNSLGIKGIRYLDEGSRQAGGTSNYVVFDPTDVKLLERNNEPLTRKEILQEQLDKIAK